MGAIAVISLVVGGIGIMNIMLANVLERRREIGLLRALGARRRDVVAQFLREASVICISGALLGLLFGTALAYAIAAFAGWQVAWAPVPILLSATRSEEHTSELQSLMRTSYAVFCLKKK